MPGRITRGDTSIAIDADTLEELATAPAAVVSDGTSTSERPIGDLVKADQYLAAKAAAGNASRGIRFGKITFGGQVSGVRGASGGFDRLC